MFKLQILIFAALHMFNTPKIHSSGDEIGRAVESCAGHTRFKSWSD